MEREAHVWPVTSPARDDAPVGVKTKCQFGREGQRGARECALFGEVSQREEKKWFVRSWIAPSTINAEL